MHDIGLGSWPRRRAPASPERIAWSYDGRQTTYGQVQEQTSALSGAPGALRGAGVQPGDRVAYVGFNHPALLETLFASSRACAITVLINPRRSVGELDYIVRDSPVLRRGPGSGARTIEGVYARVAAKLLAMAAGIWHNWKIGAANKRSLIADDH